MTGNGPPGALLASAEALLEIGRTEAARQQAAAALAHDPDDVAAMCLLARCYQADDDFGPMRDTAAHAVALAPQLHEGHRLLAFAHIGLDDAKSARASALECARIGPENWSGLAALAIAEFNLGHKRRAFRTIKRAVALAPEATGPHYIRAMMYQATGWTPAAKRAYRRALALDPEHTDALTGLGRMAVNGGRLAVAAEHISAALSVEPTDHAARTELDRTIIGGLGGWAIMAFWFAGLFGAFVMFPWMWLPTLLAPALWFGWAARTWRALSPGARAYAGRLIRSDIRARARLAGLALCALSATGLVAAGAFQDPNRPPSTVMVVLFGAHFLALIGAAVAGVTADRKVAGPPRTPSERTTQGADAAQPRPTDLLAEQRRSSTAGRWALRLSRTGAMLAVVPWLMTTDPSSPWPSRLAVCGPALLAFVGYAWWTRRRLVGRHVPPNAMLGFLLVPLGLTALLELITIAYAAAVPPAAVPAPDIVAVPGFVAIAVGLLAWLGWLPYATVRGLTRMLRRVRTQPRSAPIGQAHP